MQHIAAIDALGSGREFGVYTKQQFERARVKCGRGRNKQPKYTGDSNKKKRKKSNMHIHYRVRGEK